MISPTYAVGMRITVTGTSSVTLPAECVRVNFTVGFAGDDREPVVADTATLVGRVRSRLEEAVGAGSARELRISGLRTSTTPVDARARTAPRFSAEARGSVVLVNLDAMAALLGELASTAGVNITWLDWRLLDATVAEAQPRALADAFAQARQRAEWIARAAGLGTVEAVSVQDGGGIQPGGRQMARSFSAAESGPSIDLDPDDVDLTASLTVEFDAS